MLMTRLLPTAALLVATGLAPAMAQEFASHRAVYEVSALENGKPGSGLQGTYAYELRQTCDGAYVIHQRLRLEAAGQRGAVTEQQTQMTESKDGRSLRFEHRSLAGGKQTSLGLAVASAAPASAAASESGGAALERPGRSHLTDADRARHAAFVESLGTAPIWGDYIARDGTG